MVKVSAIGLAPKRLMHPLCNLGTLARDRQDSCRPRVANLHIFLTCSQWTNLSVTMLELSKFPFRSNIAIYPMNDSINRRKMLKLSTATIAGGAGFMLHSKPAAASSSTRPSATLATASADGFDQLKYCLNTSTIRGQKLSLPEQVDLAAAAGYDGIEPWIPELQEYVKTGSLKDLAKRIEDAGLTVESAIGFARWIVNDVEERQKGLEEARRDMEMLREIGGKRIAAPPIGAHKKPGPGLGDIAKRYRVLLELGRETEVTPQLELWGFSMTLSRLGELAYVATETADPDACVLPDVYHIYKGGSDFEGLGMIEASRMHVFHMNDYPANPTRAEIGDADRVYPGDGVAPIKKIIQSLVQNGFTGVLSLELFNRDYWKQDAKLVAETGLRKMKDAVAAAK